MKKKLLNKIYAFIITAMLFSVSANAQIVYMDIIPDKTLTNAGYYYLDLNNDGQIDFTFHVWQSFLSCGGLCSVQLDTSTIKPALLSWVSDTVNGQAAKFNSGDSINASSPHWASFQKQILYNKNATCASLSLCPANFTLTAPGSLPSFGIWNNVTDKYLALKIQVSGNIYYGWARLDAGSSGLPITIKDYAYNTIPGQPILAGQTIATGIIENSFASSINLFPNPVDNYLNIALGNNKKKIEVTITDITGKIIYTTIVRDPDSYREQKIEVNTEDFREGIYIVQIQSEDFIATKILIVKK